MQGQSFRTKTKNLINKDNNAIAIPPHIIKFNAILITLSLSPNISLIFLIGSIWCSKKQPITI